MRLQLKKKKPKKPSRKSLVRKLDQVVSEYIRKRDKKCVVCGSEQNLTNGHLFSRAAYSTRWDEVNCHANCWPCNFSHEYNFYPYQNWFVKKYGQEVYDDLYRRYRTPRKWHASDLEEMTIAYKDKLSSMDNI